MIDFTKMTNKEIIEGVRSGKIPSVTLKSFTDYLKWVKQK